MRDVVVIQRLRERGVSLADIDQVLLYESVEHKPRILDKAPSRLSLARTKEETPCYSVYLDYVGTYSLIKDEFQLEFGSFDVRGRKSQCDIEVFWTAQTLLREGITAIPAKLHACCELFKQVFTIPNDGLITKDMMLHQLDRFIPADYYTQQILKAIYRTAFEYPDLACEWIELTEFDRTFTNAMHDGVKYLSTVPADFDLKEFIKAGAAQAKADTTFMESIGKGFSSNKTKPAMIAMIYTLRETEGIMDYGYIVTGK